MALAASSYSCLWNLRLPNMR